MSASNITYLEFASEGDIFYFRIEYKGEQIRFNFKERINPNTEWLCEFAQGLALELEKIFTKQV